MDVEAGVTDWGLLFSLRAEKPFVCWAWKFCLQFGWRLKLRLQHGSARKSTLAREIETWNAYSVTVKKQTCGMTYNDKYDLGSGTTFLRANKCLPKSERDKVWNMFSEVLKEKYSDAETTEPEPPKEKINLLLVASDSDDENEHAMGCIALDRYQAELVINMFPGMVVEA
ncbi:hypothetical protein UY3_15008 [Chelonia mydas]|uniref:Uncharacterized protein n=1 Tax=Chelonia mydas TaxID=8469 RepID=M7AXT9_CHEMY|nr:hypothetical protein UY3_15008 [Chelonia mydas]